eukprot:s3083_g10.t1
MRVTWLCTVFIGLREDSFAAAWFDETDRFAFWSTFMGPVDKSELVRLGFQSLCRHWSMLGKPFVLQVAVSNIVDWHCILQHEKLFRQTLLECEHASWYQLFPLDDSERKYRKVQSGTLTFGGPRANEESQWKFISKFGYAIGTGRYEIRLRLRDALEQDQVLPRPTLEIFLDEDWPQHANIPACRRAQDVPARKTHATLAPGQLGLWGPWEVGMLYQTVRSHIWYFALSDCPDEFARRMSGSRNFSYTIDYEIRWRQFDESELSLEMRYMPVATVLVLVILTAMACWFVAKSQSMRHSAGKLHPVVRSLLFAMGLQWASQALHLIHLWVYERNGRGLPIADGFAEVLFMLSQA